MDDKVTAILKLKAPYDADPDAAICELAQFSLDNFGEGGRPEEDCLENRCGFCNTPVSNGYMRVLIGIAYSQALEYIEENFPNPIAELICVERHGQDMVDSGELDENGQPIYEEMLFQTGTQDVRDEHGNVVATTPVYLGRF